MANTLKLFRNAAVGFIDWLDLKVTNTTNGCTVRHDNSVQLHQQTKPTTFRLNVAA